MKISNALKKFKESIAKNEGYWVERAKQDFAVVLDQRRKALGMTYSAIAEKIGTSAAYITKVFRGDSNLTIESMVKLAHSTGGRLSIQIVEANVHVKVWSPVVVPGQNVSRTTSAATCVVSQSDVATNGNWKEKAAA